MNNHEEIQEVLNKIEQLWRAYPSWSFGQLIYAIAKECKQTDVFFPTNEEWIEAAKKILEQESP